MDIKFKFFKLILLVIYLFRLSYADDKKDFDINFDNKLSLIAKFYPSRKFNDRTCGILSIPDPNTISPDYNNVITFCMKMKTTEVVKTSFGKKMLYILMTGYLIDLNTGEESGSHADSGAVGMFIFEEKNSKWELVTYKDNFTFGSWGNPPEKWTLKEFGPNKWGFIDIDKYMQHGIESENYIILLVDNNNIYSSLIFKLSDNIGYYGDCGIDYQGALDIQECKKSLTNLQAKLIINKNKGTFNGYYPLEFILNGFEGYKKYNNKIDYIYYKNHKYNSPRQHNN